MHWRTCFRAGAAAVAAAIGLGLPPGEWPTATAREHAAPFKHDDRVLVRFARGIASSKRASARAAAGTDVDVAYRIVPGLERLKVRPGRTVEETIAALSRNPNVIYVEPDFEVRATVQPNDPSYASLWGMANINALAAWDVTTGSGDVVVAVIDTGIDGNHADLNENLWTNPGEVAGNGLDDDSNGYVDDVHGWDFAYDDNNPSDVHGHGTHVAGTIGALGNNGIGVVGVNWRVKLVALKFLDDTGRGFTSDAISALEYARDKGIRISNNSWGGGGYSQSLYDALARAQADGHLFVAAAGNSNANSDITPAYPASYNLESVIAVASITSADARSTFSNYGGTSIDIGAPGSGIYSTVPGGYATLSGTSMAAPHVAGAAALLLSRYPTWTNSELRAAILNTARPIPALSGKTVTGGTLDLYAALTAPQEFPVFELAPTALDFDELAAGGTSAAQVVTLTNTGAVVLPISSVSLSLNQFGVSHTCGTSVAVGESCSISVVFTPTSGGAKTATLRVTGGNGAGTKTVALSGTGIAPLYTLAPTSLAFGELAAGGTSAAQAVTLTNTGAVVLPISSVSVSLNQFGVSHTCGTSVAVGASCTISVVFQPTSAGAKTGYVSVTGGYGAGVKTVALSGTGIGPLYTLAPTSLAFGEQAVGGTSAAQAVTLTNTGTVVLPISSVSVSLNQFGVSHTCGTSVAVGASCTISVVFQPTSAGAKTGYVSVTGGYGAGVKTVALSGTGIGPLYTLAPTSLAFGEQAVGGTSAAQAVTLTNTGTVVLPIGSIGASASIFGVSHTCGTSVAVGASCTISVVFKPTSAGAKTGYVSVVGGYGAGVKTVALSGTGIVPLYTLAPTSLAFGEQAVGGTSAAQAVTLTNTGTVVLPIGSIGASASIFGVSHTCGTSVAVGASCTISVVFKPTSAGAKTGYVSVVGGYGAGVKTVALSGTGIVPLYTLAPTSLAFGEQAVGGTSAAQAVTLTNTGTVVLPIGSIGASASIFGVSHTCGTSVAVGASCTISVVFKPTSAGAKTGYVSVTGGNGAGTKTVALSGTGIV